MATLPPGDNLSPGRKPRYMWPWFLLAAVILAILLAILWVSHEVTRTRHLQQWNQTTP